MEVSIIKWVVKWIFLPVALIGMACAGVASYKQNRRCEEICRSNAYRNYRIESKGRYSGNECICTEKIDQTGNVDKLSILKIDIN
jgi:hypothetical protein